MDRQGIEQVPLVHMTDATIQGVANIYQSNPQFADQFDHAYFNAELQGAIREVIGSVIMEGVDPGTSNPDSDDSSSDFVPRQIVLRKYRQPGQHVPKGFFINDEGFYESDDHEVTFAPDEWQDLLEYIRNN